MPRFAPLSGIVFVVGLIIGFAVLGGDTPDSDEPASNIVNYYNDHQGREIAAAIVVVVSIVFLALFAVALRDYLRGAGGEGSYWPTVALVGGAVAVAGFFTAVTIHAALIDGADQHIDPGAMVALNSLDNWDFFGFTFPLAIMLFGMAGAVLKGGAALPKWLGWVGLVLAILYFAGPFGFAAFLLTGIWIIIASILMYQRSGVATA
jgi:hypothetical protein